MTRFGKILVVLIAVASLAFAGFAIVVFQGGPNWPQIASDMTDYKFTYVPGEKPVWTVVLARGDEQIASDPNLAKCIDLALADRSKRLETEIKDFQDRKSPLEVELASLQGGIKVDVPALDSYILGERKRLADLNTQWDTLNKQSLTLTGQAQDAENLTADRRSEVFQLTVQLSEVRADAFRLEALKRQISEELEQVNGNLERAEERRRQLEYNPPAEQ